jgi:hypothetical protein
MPGAGGSQSLENLPPPPVPQHSRAWPAEGSESGRVDIINYLVPLRPVWGGLRKTKCLLSSSAGRPLVAHRVGSLTEAIGSFRPLFEPRPDSCRSNYTKVAPIHIRAPPRITSSAMSAG